MIKKRNQWGKANKQSVYRDSDVMEALKRLYGATNKAGCCACGEDEPGLLDICEADDSNDFKVLCRRCRGGIARNSCNLTAKNNITQVGVTS